VNCLAVCRKSASADKDIDKKTTDAGRGQPVKFQIAADDDDDDKPEGAQLLAKAPPHIMIESPSSVKITGDSNSPTSV